MDSRRPHSPHVPAPSGHGTKAVRDQAMHWLVRKLNPAEWTAEDEKNLQQWLTLRPEHHNEYLAAQAALSLMSQPGAFSADEVARVLNRPSTPATSSASRRRWVGLAAAAAIGVAATGAWIALSQQKTYSTGLAETRQVTLPDGTTVYLDAQSSLRYSASASGRTVQLDQGTAVFEVAPNRSPFLVTTGSWTVRDIGTTFQVQLRSGPTDTALEVSVAEGEVELASTRHPETPPVRLLAGEETTWNSSGAQPAARGRAPERVDFAPWREGRLRYRNQPLTHVLADLQRYHRGRLVLADPELGQMTVTGTISTRDLKQAFATLEQVLPVQFASAGGGEVRITRR